MTPEFLRTLPHLRGRTVLYASLGRLRSSAAYATHDFFHQRGFMLMHAPVLTGNDCEGGGECFIVLTPDELKASMAAGTANSVKYLMGQPMYLTVSGQLHTEAAAAWNPRVYTFGLLLVVVKGWKKQV